MAWVLKRRLLIIASTAIIVAGSGCGEDTWTYRSHCQNILQTTLIGERVVEFEFEGWQGTGHTNDLIICETQFDLETDSDTPSENAYHHLPEDTQTFTLSDLDPNTTYFVQLMSYTERYNRGHYWYSNVLRFQTIGPPTVLPTASPRFGLVPLTVTLDASGSYDPGGRISSYTWKPYGYDENESISEMITTITYTEPGEYIPMVTVVDEDGLSMTAGNQVSVVGLDDPHMRVINDDTDGDFITDNEEIAIGKDPQVADENENNIADGIELAMSMANDIWELPTESHSEEGEVYIRWYGFADSMDFCPMCRCNVLVADCYIADPSKHAHSLDGLLIMGLELHFMEHGSFNLSGRQRVSIIELAELLNQ